MFTSTARSASALTPIAELLFTELQEFGRLSTTHAGILGDAKGYMLTRARSTLRLLSVLEEKADLRWNATLPHSYAFGHWPDDLPIGGYILESKNLRPSLVVNAMVDHWEAAAQGYSTYLRLLRSAIFMMHTKGLPVAVEYLLNLHRAGVTPQGESILRAITALLLARASVATDEEVVPFLLQSQPATSLGAWQDTLSQAVAELARLGTPWLARWGGERGAAGSGSRFVLTTMLTKRRTSATRLTKAEGFFNTQVRL